MVGLQCVLLLAVFIFSANLISALSSEGFDTSCQTHITQGYGYRLFFKVPLSSHLKSGAFQFNFSLSGPSNGHVMLSEETNTQNAYEIVLGAGSNGFSALRKFDNSKSETKTDPLTEGILSSNEIRNFSITINQGDIILTAHNNGTIKTILAWKDPNPLDLKFVSFCAWTGVTVVWYYDCKGAEPVKQELSTYRKLKNRILKSYDPYSIPVKHDGHLAINTLIDLHHFNLDVKKSVLTTHAKFNLSWNDFKIKWNPEDFDNISSIHLLHREIWLPEFILHNSIDDGSSPLSKAIIKINHTGEISWSPKAHMLTWCILNLKDWPFDSHSCSVKLGLIPYPESVSILLAQRIQPNLALRDSEWDIISVFGEMDTNYRTYESNQTDFGDERYQALSLKFELKRQSKLYIYSYFVPVIGSIIIVFISFWLPVFSRKRLLLHFTCFMLLLINLLALDMAVPLLATSSPYIMTVCGNLLVLTTLHIIFSSFILSISESDQSSPSKFMNKIVTNSTIQSLFCLIGKYHTIEESMIRDEYRPNSEEISHFILFGIILDRLVFGLSLLSICIILI